MSAALVGLWTGCSSEKAAVCPQGQERCACYGNDTCDKGLECRSNLCVDPDSKGNDPPSNRDASASGQGGDGGGSGGSGSNRDGGGSSNPSGTSAASNDPGSSGNGGEGGTTPVPTGGSSSDVTPVAVHGQLRVAGTSLVDAQGNPVQLKGVSSMWLNWDPVGYSQSLDGLIYMRDHWNLSVIRAAMGIDAEGAYLTDPTEMKQMLTRVVDNAIEAGVYVIVDWHDHEAHLHQAEASAFFQEIASKYKDVPNVLYETFNEPLDDVSWSGTVKPYHQAMIDVIRAEDPDNVIILGSPHWSQDVDVAAADPVNGANLMYTVHFYACSHGSYQRAKAQTALASGLPLFVTEWGAADADGGTDGVVCESEAAAWLNWFDQEGISWAAWKLDGCTDSTCFFKNRNVSPDGPWDASDLNGHAPFVIERMQAGGSVSPVPSSNPTSVPTSGTGDPPSDCVPSGTCADGDGMDCVDGELVARNCAACSVLACGLDCCDAVGSLGAITYPSFIEQPQLVTGFTRSATSADLEMSFTGYNQMGAITFALDAAELIYPQDLRLDLEAFGSISGQVTVSLENGAAGCQYPVVEIDVGVYGLYTSYPNCWDAFELSGLGSVRQINVRVDSDSSGVAELHVYSISW